MVETPSPTHSPELPCPKGWNEPDPGGPTSTTAQTGERHKESDQKSGRGEALAEPHSPR